MPGVLLHAAIGATFGLVLGPASWRAALALLRRRGLLGEASELVSLRVAMLVGALTCAVLGARYGVSPESLQLMVFVGPLLAASLTDLAARVIPRECVGAALLVRLAYALVLLVLRGVDAFFSLVLASAFGAIAVFVPLTLLVLAMDAVLGKESMGGGDLRLFGVAGAFFGWRRCLVLVPLSCALGIMQVLLEEALVRAGSAGREGEPLPDVLHKSFAFGPSIACACLLCALAGP